MRVSASASAMVGFWFGGSVRIGFMLVIAVHGRGTTKLCQISIGVGCVDFVVGMRVRRRSADDHFATEIVLRFGVSLVNAKPER